MTKFEPVIIEPRKLLTVCRLQAEIISELHPKVFGFPAIDAKVAELQRMLEDANLDGPLRKIQCEAFEAGYSANNDGVISYDIKEDSEWSFNEWVKNNV